MISKAEGCRAAGRPPRVNSCWPPATAGPGGQQRRTQQQSTARRGRRTATPAGDRTAGPPRPPPDPAPRSASANTDTVAVTAAAHRFQGVQQPGEQHPHSPRRGNRTGAASPARCSPAGPAAPRSGGAPHRRPSPAAQRRSPPPHPPGAPASRRAAARASARHPEQHERRGRTHCSPSSRTPRPQAWPHGRSSPAHPGQRSSPPAGADRPRAGPYLPSTPGASKHQATALPSGQGFGRAAALPRRPHALVANEEGQPPGPPSRSSSPSMTPDHLHVVSHGVAQQP